MLAAAPESVHEVLHRRKYRQEPGPPAVASAVLAQGRQPTIAADGAGSLVARAELVAVLARAGCVPERGGA